MGYHMHASIPDSWNCPV